MERRSRNREITVFEIEGRRPKQNSVIPNIRLLLQQNLTFRSPLPLKKNPQHSSKSPARSKRRRKITTLHPTTSLKSSPHEIRNSKKILLLFSTHHLFSDFSFETEFAHKEDGGGGGGGDRGGRLRRRRRRRIEKKEPFSLRSQCKEILISNNIEKYTSKSSQISTTQHCVFRKQFFFKCGIPILSLLLCVKALHACAAQL